MLQYIKARYKNSVQVKRTLSIAHARLTVVKC
jgi:hypothetical protein